MNYFLFYINKHWRSINVKETVLEYIKETPPTYLLMKAFSWCNTNEGQKFWYDYHQKWTFILEKEKID